MTAPAAIISALEDALAEDYGVRLTTIPMTSTRLYDLLRAQPRPAVRP